MRVVGVENMVVYYDSQVVTSQINGNYECKNERMRRYLEEVKGRIGGLQIQFVQILREENECANHRAKVALAEYMLIPDQVLSFDQISSLITEVTSVQEIGTESNWTTPLVSYIRNDMLLDGKDDARKLKVQAS